MMGGGLTALDHIIAYICSPALMPALSAGEFSIT
jgi:hypothetical protein